MRGEPLRPRGGDDVVGILVLGDGLPRRLEPRVVRLVQPAPKLRLRLEDVLPVQVRHEARAHDGAVLVGDVGIADDVVDLHAAPAAEAGERRRKQEEPDAVLEVERLDPGEDGERRVVDHDAALRVLEGLVVAARPERPHDVRLLNAPSLSHVVEHDGVHLRRRVAVVRGPLRLELLDEALVVVEALPALAHVPPRARLLAGMVAPPSRGMRKAPPERGLTFR